MIPEDQQSYIRSMSLRTLKKSKANRALETRSCWESPKHKRCRLVILTSRFEATRGLFWDGPRNFEPRSDDEDDTYELAPPSPNFHATAAGGRLTTTYDLTCNRPHTRRIFSGIGIRTWNPPAPKPRP
ncbi:hypothetical protein AVEN_248275-1 [Araneus ventricosus]|uniref:Uncharacterized protein n=1 Tax=Araneus ventricosus TaxID=182803 RepID=A0A4Y2KD90_ARAVE|nr:hypothetical protein AVEN_248275-1 [Araneus ventricosus]